jgi:formylglycine-generating enzyme required for sulfatase activity
MLTRPGCRTGTAALDLLPVPAGPFLYGEEDEPLTLPAYRLARTPVTNAQYQAFVGASGHRAPDHWINGTLPPGKEDHPVVYTSRDDALAFCAWAGCRLPTEQEWEKAARGTDGRAYPWGDEWQGGRCNSYEARIGGTAPVGRYPGGAGPYGHLGLAANVLEWCAEGSGIVRGGWWDSTAEDVRAVVRGRCNPAYRLPYVGFRCAGL